LMHPLTLRARHAAALGRAYLRYRNPRRQRVGREHVAFHEQIWHQAAEQLGASCRKLGDGILEIELGDARTRVLENVTAIDDPVTLAVMHNKPLTHRILTQQGLPVPRHAAFTLKDPQPAMKFLAAEAEDCVVKPANGTGGGRGVTTGIRTHSHLARAAAAAAVYCDELLIERQYQGHNYRLLYLDGELVDAFQRRSPSVTGDGRSSIRNLVRKANEARGRAGVGVSQALLTIDLDMKRTLARQGLSLRSTPPANTEVQLKTVINENRGADNVSAMHSLHPSIIADGERAVGALGARFAGIDVITTDPTVPLAQSGGVIIEVNGTPNLYYHYHKRDGSFPIAKLLLERLLASRNESQPPITDSTYVEEASHV
jgi:D-alanine-D-alanine ligase-like ATP-grasp enzyme